MTEQRPCGYYRDGICTSTDSNIQKCSYTDRQMRLCPCSNIEPLKCEYCDLNVEEECGMFGMTVEHASRYPCHMDEDKNNIKRDKCCSIIDGKVVPRCDHFEETALPGRDGMFGRCKKMKFVNYIKWFLGDKLCQDFTKAKPRQVLMDDLR